MHLAERGRKRRREEIDIAREEELEGPLGHDAEFAVEARQFHEVDAAPHEPRDEAGEAHAKDLRDGFAMADGGELAEAGEGEGLQLFAGEGGGDVFADERTLAHGKLRGLRAQAAVVLRIRGAIACGPHIAETFREAGGIDDDLATLERQRPQAPRLVSMGCGALPTVQTTRLAGKLTPSLSCTVLAVTARTRHLKTIFTPIFVRQVPV